MRSMYNTMKCYNIIYAFMQLSATKFKILLFKTREHSKCENKNYF